MAPVKIINGDSDEFEPDGKEKMVFSGSDVEAGGEEYSGHEESRENEAIYTDVEPPKGRGSTRRPATKKAAAKKAPASKQTPLKKTPAKAAAVKTPTSAGSARRIGLSRRSAQREISPVRIPPPK